MKWEDIRDRFGLTDEDGLRLDATLKSSFREGHGIDEIFLLNFDADSVMTNDILRFFMETAQPGIDIAAAIRDGVRICCALPLDHDDVLQAFPENVSERLRGPAPDGKVYVVIVRKGMTHLIGWTPSALPKRDIDQALLGDVRDWLWTPSVPPKSKPN